MGRIRVHEFVSLDGVFEDPSWTMEYGFTDEMGAAIGALTGASTTILLGRTTWEAFAPAWSTRSAEDDPGAPFFNDTPKHVVSSSPVSAATWQNSVGIGTYDPDAIRKLAADADADVFVSGSGTLVRAMLADGLVDELHLFVYPVVLGAGVRLFPDGTPHLSLSLIAQQGFTNGVTQLTYGPARS